MKSIILAICAGVLFFLLSPATFFRLPPKGSKFAVAAVHATLFAFIFYVGCKYVSPSSVLEGACNYTTGECTLKVNGTEKCKPKDAKFTWSNDIDPDTKISNGTVGYKCGKGSGTGGAWKQETGNLGSINTKDRMGYPIKKDSKGYQFNNLSQIKIDGVSDADKKKYLT